MFMYLKGDMFQQNLSKPISSVVFNNFVAHTIHQPTNTYAVFTVTRAVGSNQTKIYKDKTDMEPALKGIIS